jgi:hypothetical protein
MKQMFTKEGWSNLTDKEKVEIQWMQRMGSKPKSYYFWSTVHNTGTLIQWVVLLPFTPVIAVIQAIRGDL